MAEGTTQGPQAQAVTEPAGSVTSRTVSGPDALMVVRRYFEGLAAHDLDAAVACWAPGRTDRLVGVADLPTPDGVRDYFASLFDAFPDFRVQMSSTTVEGDRCAGLVSVDSLPKDAVAGHRHLRRPRALPGL